jgi:malate dehydrogenase (oxaloacetate-decarboxylating)(NADP+)
MNKPVHVLQLGSTVQSIVNMVIISVVDAQLKCRDCNVAEEVSRSKWWKPFQKVAHDV